MILNALNFTKLMLARQTPIPDLMKVRPTV